MNGPWTLGAKLRAAPGWVLSVNRISRRKRQPDTRPFMLFTTPRVEMFRILEGQQSNEDLRLTGFATALYPRHRYASPQNFFKFTLHAISKLLLRRFSGIEELGIQDFNRFLRVPSTGDKTEPSPIFTR